MQSRLFIFFQIHKNTAMKSPYLHTLPGVKALFLALFFMASCNSEMPEKKVVLHQNIFAPVGEHTHGSTIAELPNGDLLAAWFQGSGERWADDVRIMGARLLSSDTAWTDPFLMADVPGFPDVNPVLFVDNDARLWLFWYTVIANQWDTSLPAYRTSKNYMQRSGPPEWAWQQSLFVKPGGKTERGILADDPFVASVRRQIELQRKALEQQTGGDPEVMKLFERWKEQLLYKSEGKDMMRSGYYTNEAGERIDTLMGFPYYRRVGWQTKNKPVQLSSGRIILPLYSDGLNLSLMAITDDGGSNWHYSEPLVGAGNIQPTIAVGKSSLTAYMRDNGPPPKRLLASNSADDGKTWSPVHDTEIYNSGAGSDVVVLQNGHWVLANNDLEVGRYSLALYLSEDEGKSWPWIRHLELSDGPENANSYSYPSVIEGINGNIHVVYTYSMRNAPDGKGKTIRYARVTEDWIREGD
jgi:predicted neuraminidase